MVILVTIWASQDLGEKKKAKTKKKEKDNGKILCWKKKFQTCVPGWIMEHPNISEA
jgi:hypothetical protein